MKMLYLYPRANCPRCNSRQWVRIRSRKREWRCYECPDKVNPKDVVEWSFIGLANTEPPDLLPSRRNTVIHSRNYPVPGSRTRIPLQSRDPLLPRIPGSICSCGCRQFFRYSEGDFHCYKCEKPPQDSMIEEWWFLA